jgi:hypothetical protein
MSFPSSVTYYRWVFGGDNRAGFLLRQETAEMRGRDLAGGWWGAPPLLS